MDLKEFSGLPEEDLRRLATVWPTLPAVTRRELVQTWNTLAAENFALDFSSVYRMAIRDQDAEVRTAAIMGLIEDEDIRLVPQLIEILERDTAAAVRAAAAQALAHFVLLGELHKIRPRPFDSTCTALTTAYNNLNEDLDVRRRALEALGYTSLAGVPEMIEAAYAHAEEQMRISAVLAMGRSADKRWAKIVARELLNPLPDMRYEATRACGELALPEAIPALIELADDVNVGIQKMALWALGQIGGKQAQRVLEQHVDSDNPVLRQAARDALEELDFLHGDLSTFFGPPTEFDGESEVNWAEDGDIDEKLKIGFGEDDLDEEDFDAADDFTDEDEDELLALYLAEDEEDDLEDDEEDRWV
ncbi:MAG TPA: HEAT repeat domain-containing protein [Anaerolineae bacterium]|nr:HEAT repeat domain-containing protein [Anaerolineae bacterium]HQH38179.1 HEAT repeat domain-containing protein [Anaerolineae bacterium]